MFASNNQIMSYMSSPFSNAFVHDDYEFEDDRYEDDDDRENEDPDDSNEGEFSF